MSMWWGREVLCDLSYNAITCSHEDLPVNRLTYLKMLPSPKLCAGGSKHLVIGIVTGAFSLSAFYHLNLPLHHLPPSFPPRWQSTTYRIPNGGLYTVSWVFLANRVLYLDKNVLYLQIQVIFSKNIPIFFRKIPLVVLYFWTCVETFLPNSIILQ